MPRYFFYIRNGTGLVPDDEGIDLADQADASRMAMDSIRSIIAEEARRGVIDLDGQVEIKDAAGEALTTIVFTEAFSLRLPDRGPVND